MDRPNSTTSIDTAIAAEALDLFDEQGLSNPGTKPSRLVMASSPRLRTSKDLRQSPTLRDSGTLPWRRASMDSVRQRSVTTPTRPRGASASQKRPDSPDIETYLKRTPRPRRSSSAVFAGAPSLKGGSRSQSTTSLRSAAKKDQLKSGVPDDYSSLLGKLEDDSDSDNDGGSETDSSIDVTTPLPHLMFRDGVLSPRSKLLPHDLRASATGNAPDRSQSVLSIVSNAGSVMTKSGLQKDPRDTERRRIRHKDGRLLRAGMGLTTGLGWSDSEDEDAPSALTRRLIRTTVERTRSTSTSVFSSTVSSRPNSEVFPSELSFSGFTTSVSTSKPSLARKVPQTDLRTKVGAHTLRSASVTFPSMGSKLARPKQSMDSIASRDRSDSLSSYSQASFVRSRAESLSSVATQGSHTRERTNSTTSRENMDTLRTAMKTPTSSKSNMIQPQKSFSSSPVMKISDKTESTAKPILRSRSDSVTPQHLRADPSLLKLRTITKTATVMPPDDVTPTSESPLTPTTIPKAGPLGTIAHSKSTLVPAGINSGIPKTKVVASPARRVEVTLPSTHVEFDVEKVSADQALPSYATPVLSSLPTRGRAESSASATTSSSYSTDLPNHGEMTHTASASTSSLASTAESSSASHGSSGSSSSVPRPLRLPQRAIARAFTQDSYMTSSSSIASVASTSTSNGERYQRQRAVSGPRPYRPNVTSPAPTSPPATRTSTFPPIGVSQNSASSYVSPVTSPAPTSATSSPPPSSTFSPLSSPGSLRPRPPTVVGAREPRPKPRTGTGMVYRTSSFGNIQDPRMRNMMLSSAVLDRATATTSGSVQPIRI